VEEGRAHDRFSCPLEKKIVACVPLDEPHHAEQLAALQDLMVDAPAIG
jgi:hypothetical protein